MHKFNINFRKSAGDRVAEISTRAHNHYLRIRPFVGKIYRPFKELHNKYITKKYGKS